MKKLLSTILSICLCALFYSPIPVKNIISFSNNDLGNYEQNIVNFANENANTSNSICSDSDGNGGIPGGGGDII